MAAILDVGQGHQDTILEEDHPRNIYHIQVCSNLAQKIKMWKVNRRWKPKAHIAFGKVS